MLVFACILNSGIKAKALTTERANPMQADKSHLHHVLMQMGLSSRQTLALLVAYATACAGFGRLLEQVPESVSLLIYFVLFVCHCAFVIKAFEVSTVVRRWFGMAPLNERLFHN